MDIYIYIYTQPHFRSRSNAQPSSAMIHEHVLPDSDSVQGCTDSGTGAKADPVADPDAEHPSITNVVLEYLEQGASLGVLTRLTSTLASPGTSLYPDGRLEGLKRGRSSA